MNGVQLKLLVSAEACNGKPRRGDQSIFQAQPILQAPIGEGCLDFFI